MTRLATDLERNARELAFLVLTDWGKDGDQARGILCDMAEDDGGAGWPVVQTLRAFRDHDSLLLLLRMYGGRLGRAWVSTHVKRMLETAGGLAWSRRLQRDSSPEWYRSDAGWMLPSGREDPEGFLAHNLMRRSIRPYQADRQLRASSHCSMLVRRYVGGQDVPPDVRLVCQGLAWGLRRVLMEGRLSMWPLFGVGRA